MVNHKFAKQILQHAGCVISIFYMLFHFVAFRTCTTAKVMEHLTRMNETVKNGCEPP